MPVLRFKAEDVRRVVEHSIAAPRQSDVAYTTKPVEAPAVLLVHDQGVYRMSNGQPRDSLGADADDRSFCAYAIGCHPEKDADWYETARSGRRRRLRRDAAMGAQAEGADRRRREDHHAAHD